MLLRHELVVSLLLVLRVLLVLLRFAAGRRDARTDTTTLHQRTAEAVRMVCADQAAFVCEPMRADRGVYRSELWSSDGRRRTTKKARWAVDGTGWSNHGVVE